MTVAVCIRCGSQKVGAWTYCSGCRFEPSTNVEKAQSVILSDHHISPEDLEKVAAQLRAGQAFEYPPEIVDGYLEQLKLHPNLDKEVGKFFLQATCLSFGAILAVTALLVWLL